MFSKHRKLFQTLTCCLAAVCLCLAWGLWTTWVEGDRGTTAETTPPPDSTMAAGDSTQQSENVVPTFPDEANSGRGRIGWRFAAFGLLVAAVGLVVAYLCLNRQERVWLGPEAEAMLIPALVMAALVAGASLSLWRGTLCAALLAPAIVLLGNLVAWFRHGFPLEWSGIHRLARLAGGKGHPYRLYPLLVALVFLLTAAGAAALLIPGPWYYRPFGVVLAFWSLMALLCMLRFGLSADSLLAAIGKVSRGEPLPEANGLFREEQRRLSQLQQQKDEAVRAAVTGERFKVELISNVSHDLRTPLTAILGYGELLQQESLSPAGAQRLALLNRKAGYMRELVDALFEMTKVSSGAMAPHWEKLDLIRLLEQTIGLLDDRLTEAGLAVRRRYPADTLPITSDGGRLHQVFANLLENAIKYALAGTRIYLDAEVPGDSVRIRMTNTASYEMDFRPEEIVQRFARGDKARSTRGSGLGLAIAQTYTESLGGSFHVEVDGDQFRAVVELPIDPKR